MRSDFSERGVEAADTLDESVSLNRYSCMFLDMEEHYKCLLGTISGIVYTLDEKGHFSYLSDSVSLLGFSRSELLGKHFSYVVHPDYVHSVSRDDVLPLYNGRTTGSVRAPKLFDERRTHPRKTTDLELPFLTKELKSNNENSDALLCKVAASGQYITKNNQPCFCGTVGVIECSTVLTKVEARGMKHSGHPMPSIRTIAHDFNNVLTAIYGYVHLLEMSTKTKENTLTFNIIKENLERAADLVRRLGTFTRRKPN